MVYPRVGGGNAALTDPRMSAFGLSPRGRGKRATADVRDWRERSIPAWAGETHQQRRPMQAPKVYPRVGGGNHSGLTAYVYIEGLSPRGRGKPNPFMAYKDYQGSIPAWAGETYRPSCASTPKRVYPRVGGGNFSDTPMSMRAKGLSPRGRGKPPPVLYV